MVLSMPSWLCCEITHNKLPNFTHTQFQIFSNTSTWKTCQKPCTRSTLTTSGWSTKSSMTSVKQGSTTCRNLLPPKQSKTQQQKLLPPLIQGYLFATLSFSFIFCSGFGFCWLKTKLWSFILITLFKLIPYCFLHVIHILPNITKLNLSKFYLNFCFNLYFELSVKFGLCIQ